MKDIKIELKWAIIFTITLLLWMVFENKMGWHGEKIEDHAWLTMFFMIPSILIYILEMKDKRKQLGGYMTWKQGFVSGMIMSFIIAALTPLTQWITSNYICPEYFPNVIAYAVENGQMDLEEAGNFFSMKSYIFQGSIGAIVMGIITSAIVALFVKKSPE